MSCYAPTPSQWGWAPVTGGFRWVLEKEEQVKFHSFLHILKSVAESTIPTLGADRVLVPNAWSLKTGLWALMLLRNPFQAPFEPQEIHYHLPSSWWAIGPILSSGQILKGRTIHPLPAQRHLPSSYFLASKTLNSACSLKQSSSSMLLYQYMFIACAMFWFQTALFAWCVVRGYCRTRVWLSRAKKGPDV